MLDLPGAWVRSVTFGPEGVVVGLARRFRKLTCPVCGWSTRSTYDRSVRRWRHLDLGGSRLFLECEIRRLRCGRCERVVTEAVPWARPRAWHTRDLQDLAAHMAQRMDKTTVCRLLRLSYEALVEIIELVVAGEINDERLDDLVHIGVDEVSYRTGHRYLTVVADHDTGSTVVWAGEGKNADALAGFYELLGPERCQRIEAVSLDMGGAFAKATRQHAPQARMCIDPFHVIKLANEAIDKVRRTAWNDERHHRRVGRPPNDIKQRAKTVKHTRWALLKDPGKLTVQQTATLQQLKADRSVLYRCWQLKEALRDIYRLADPDDAQAHLNWWLSWACRCRIPEMVKLSNTIRKHRDGIVAAVELGLSNSRLEGLNSKIRLINHRGYGHHTAKSLIAMIYLCCGGLTIALPFR
jgi:transposase